MEPRLLPDWCVRLQDQARPLPGVDPETSRCAWRVWGDGPPLLLIHGGAGSWLHWAPVIQPLAANFRVLAPDLPGFGDRRDGVARSPAEIAEGAAADLAQTSAPLTGLTVAAFSFGSLPAADLVSGGGLDIRGLTLIGPAGLSGPRSLRLEMESTKHYTGAERRAAVRRNLLRFMLHKPEAADDDAAAIHLLNTQPRPMSTREWSLSDYLDHRLGAAPAALSVIWGEHDPMAAGHLDARAALVRALRPDAEIRRLSGYGHWIMKEIAPGLTPAAASALFVGGPRAQDQ